MLRRTLRVRVVLLKEFNFTIVVKGYLCFVQMFLLGGINYIYNLQQKDDNKIRKSKTHYKSSGGGWVVAT